MVLRSGRLGGFAGRLGAAAVVAGMLLGLDAIAFQGGPPGEAGRKAKVKLGLSVNDPKAYQGYTLLAPMKSQKTYLIDMDGRVVKTWEAKSNPALSAYLLDNGHLFRPA